jgi:dihydroorotate dehydrogenase
MINAIGLQNPGSDVVINDIMPRLDKTKALNTGIFFAKANTT